MEQFKLLIKKVLNKIGNKIYSLFYLKENLYSIVLSLAIFFTSLIFGDHEFALSVTAIFGVIVLTLVDLIKKGGFVIGGRRWGTDLLAAYLLFPLIAFIIIDYFI